jgi:hypothetical protein
MAAKQIRETRVDILTAEILRKGVTFVGRPPGIVFHPHFRGSEFGAEISAELSTTTTGPCCLAKIGHLRTVPRIPAGTKIVPRSSGSLYGVLNLR